MSLLAVLVLGLLAGCAGSGASQAPGSEVAWSTGGGGNANADPVPSQPAISSSAPEAARVTEDSESPASLPPAVSTQDEAGPATGGEDGSDSSQRDAGDAKLGTARSELDDLAVKGKDHRSGYQPEMFDWRSDVDRNGCDTHNDVLRRDLKNIVIEAGTQGCVVTSGDLEDEYLGDSYSFELGSAAVDVDHIVSPSSAWQTGAAALSYDALQEFGSDPLNLLTVSSDLKRQKDAGDAATWLPPNESYQCEYVSRQIAVKHKYGLWVSAPEKDAMQRVLDTCADQPAFAEDVAWPEPGEDDSPGTQSASEDSSEEPSGTSSPDPTEKAPEHSAGDSSAGGSEAADSSTADAPAGDTATGDSGTAPPSESNAPAAESAADGRRGDR